MSVIKTPYEISLWEDRLTFVDIYDNEYENVAPEGVTIKTSYLKEIKLCVIGSDKFKSPITVTEPNLTRNVNGSNSLNFSIYSKYYDEKTESFLDNPFIPLLVNERKVKLKTIIKGKIRWFDFLIKNISENSENYSFTYTANDLFVNELGKSGFNLEFSEELENNYGTVNELGAAILQGTDWKIGEETEVIQQFQEEALYEITLNQAITAKDAFTHESKIIQAGKKIYAFYSSVISQNYDFFQFIYNEDGNYQIDSNRVILNGEQYYLSYTSYNRIEAIIALIRYISDYRGKRIVRTQEVAFDSILNKYVNVYKDEDGLTVYGYTDSIYISKNLAQSFISNGENFVSPSAWSQNKKEKLTVISVPSFEVAPSTYITRESTLKYEQSNGNFLFNSGFKDNLKSIQEIAKGDKFVFRIKAGTLSDDKLSLIHPKNIRFKIQVRLYQKKEDGSFILNNNESDILLEGITDSFDKLDPQGYFITRIPMECKWSCSEEFMLENKIGIFITAISDTNEIISETYYIQGAQLFRYYLDGNENMCLPGGEVLSNDSGTEKIDSALLSYTETKNYYYYPNSFDSKENIEFIYIGNDENQFKPKYRKNYEKVRSITGSESNRFNLLQNLGEIFECWCKIEVKHKDTGEIMLGKDVYDNTLISAGTSSIVMEKDSKFIAGNSKTIESLYIRSGEVYPEYSQQKFITFHKNVGQINNADFIYGINLKSIERNLESEEFVSKLIVKNNNNEHAKFGSCSIARAKENPSGENFLLNFDYYVNQGLINRESFYNDLYSLDNNWIGFYRNLKQLNLNLEKLNSDYTTIFASFSQAKSQQQTYKLQYDASVEQLIEKEQYFIELTQHSFDKIDPENSWLKDPSVIAIGNEITRLRAENIQLKKKATLAEENIKEIELKLKDLDEEINANIIKKRKIINLFEKKYSQFIQEGSWNSDDYIDDNLYYLDAEMALFGSCQPKVSYTINIVELSSLEKYKNYSFDLGDITHIQDTEFFGWQYTNNVKTPYKEKIIVTEMTNYFDEPNKNIIKVQNYRTHFEDLFQRLTATSQQIEYRAGAYERAAGVVDENGNIISGALADALGNNPNPFQNQDNQSVSWGKDGITTTNLNNPAEILKITSGGIFITDDGGNTWATGITGRGINAKMITTGQLNTKTITIMNGDEVSFRWDSLGISAYYKSEKGKYNNKTFVRFDQYGIYGVKDLDDNFEPSSEKEIWDRANFALTWKGFMLKSGDDQGSISIDTENDLNVYGTNNTELIRLGRLDDSGTYGIRIKGSDGVSDALRATQKEFITGGWTVEPGGLYSSNTKNNNTYEVGLFSKELAAPITILNNTRTDWRIVVGNKFGVDFEGNLYASNASISGTINATSGNIGGIEIKNGFMSVPMNHVLGLQVLDSEGRNLFMGLQSYDPENPSSVFIGPWTTFNEGLAYFDTSVNKIVQLKGNGFVILQIGEDGKTVISEKSINWETIIDKLEGL